MAKLVRDTYTQSRAKMETTLSESVVVPAAAIKAFKDAITAAKVAALPLAKIDKRMVDDSEVKFLLIRAERIVYTANEALTGKSGEKAQRS